MTLERERAALLEHVAADNGDGPKEYCDRHGGYVDEGRTQPYGSRSGYRICDGCADEGRRQVASRESYHSCGYLDSFHVDGRCPKELGHDGARAKAGEERAICGETHDVTAGAGCWDVGTCWLTPDHDGDCDFQVNAPGEA
ncbi:MAG TPA: hypothetical protein VEW95_09345 [Candidatus Limnocylindrales bacterium]|nr:hypothetical protein [Candidatus Limnocylindrales bacterium]